MTFSVGQILKFSLLGVENEYIYHKVVSIDPERPGRSQLVYTEYHYLVDQIWFKGYCSYGIDSFHDYEIIDEVQFNLIRS